MAKSPIVLEVFWNEELNGGRIEDIVQVIDDTKYYWKCHSCNGYYSCCSNGFLRYSNYI